MMKKKEKQPVWKPKHKLKADVAAAAAVMQVVVPEQVAEDKDVVHRVVQAADREEAEVLVVEEDKPPSPKGEFRRARE
jgi:hypothetical protein